MNFVWVNPENIRSSPTEEFMPFRDRGGKMSSLVSKEEGRHVHVSLSKGNLCFVKWRDFLRKMFVNLTKNKLNYGCPRGGGGI